MTANVPYLQLTYNSLTAPGLIGQWTKDIPSAPEAGPLLWLGVDRLKVAPRPG